MKPKPIQVYLSEQDLERLVAIGKHFGYDVMNKPGRKSPLGIDVSATVRLCLVATAGLIEDKPVTLASLKGGGASES